MSSWIPEPILSRNSDPPMGILWGLSLAGDLLAQTSPSPSPTEAHAPTSRPRISALVQQPRTSPPWAELSPPSALGALPRCPSKAELQGTSPSTASPSRVASAAVTFSLAPGLPGTSSAHRWRVRTWLLGRPSPAILPHSPQRAPEAVPLPSQLGPAPACSSFSPTPGGQPQHASGRPSSIPVPTGVPNCTWPQGLPHAHPWSPTGTLEAPKFSRRRVPCGPLLNTQPPPLPPPPRQALPPKIQEVSGSFSPGSPSNPSELTGEGDQVCVPPESRVEALTPTPQVLVPTEPSREDAHSGRDIPNPGSALRRKNTSCRHLAAQPWEEGLDHSPLRLLWPSG